MTTNNEKIKRLLLVEDEAIIALTQKRQLERMGYCIVHCMTGEDAVATACGEEEQIDLVLMDINLGDGIDGTQAAEQILKIKDIPILFLSSHTEKEVVEKTESITNYGYVVKNSNITVLDASIKMAFKLFDAYQENETHKQKLLKNNEEMRRINLDLSQSKQELQKSESAVRNKLSTILDPEGDITTLLLSDIIDKEMIQSLMEDFYDLTGILGAILDIEGNIVLAVGWQDICTKFHRCHPVTAQFCKESDTELTQNVKQGEFKLYRCKNNMWDMVTPLYINERQVGNVFIGQFIFEDEEVDIETFTKQAVKYNFDKDEYLSALKRVPRFSREKAETGMAFYAKIAKIISTQSYSSIKLSRTISERERSDEKVRKLLAEKELLLKEIHHRIRNNLLSMKTILIMQSENIENEEGRHILLNATSRLESMRLLYDNLYLTGDYQKLYLEDYILNMTVELGNIFMNACDLNFEISIENLLLSAQTASKIGIILDELITNSVKHAFSNLKKGLIRIDIKSLNNKINIYYNDNGKGMPDDFSFDTVKGFGMKLVKMLVDEFSGTLVIENREGASFQIKLNAPDEKV